MTIQTRHEQLRPFFNASFSILRPVLFHWILTALFAERRPACVLRNAAFFASRMLAERSRRRCFRSFGVPSDHSRSVCFGSGGMLTTFRLSTIRYPAPADHRTDRRPNIGTCLRLAELHCEHQSRYLLAHHCPAAGPGQCLRRLPDEGRLQAACRRTARCRQRHGRPRAVLLA